MLSHSILGSFSIYIYLLLSTAATTPLCKSPNAWSQRGTWTLARAMPLILPARRWTVTSLPIVGGPQPLPILGGPQSHEWGPVAEQHLSSRQLMKECHSAGVESIFSSIRRLCPEDRHFNCRVNRSEQSPRLAEPSASAKGVTSPSPENQTLKNALCAFGNATPWCQGRTKKPLPQDGRSRIHPRCVGCVMSLGPWCACVSERNRRTCHSSAQPRLLRKE